MVEGAGGVGAHEDDAVAHIVEAGAGERGMFADESGDFAGRNVGKLGHRGRDDFEAGADERRDVDHRQRGPEFFETAIPAKQSTRNAGRRVERGGGE